MENRRGEVWIESLPLGNTSKWVQQEYDEDARIQLEDRDLSKFDDGQTRKNFGELYPIAYQRLMNYERILQEASQQYGVNLQMGYGGGGGIVVFFANAKVRVEGLALDEKLDEIKRNITALESAFDRIEKYEIARSSGT